MFVFGCCFAGVRFFVFPFQLFYFVLRIVDSLCCGLLLFYISLIMVADVVCVSVICLCVLDCVECFVSSRLLLLVADSFHVFYCF